jgi:hypothetical protein
MQAVSKSSLAMLALGLAAFWTPACGDDPNRPAEVDLLARLPAAERRAGGDVADAVRVDVVSAAGDARTALVMRAPARVTWTVQLPLHARFASALALVPASPSSPGVTVRVGLSDDRIYHEIGKAEVTGTWMPFTLDLREHSEWKFSLFHQPLRKRWRLVLNADATPGGTVAWDLPRLTKS